MAQLINIIIEMFYDEDLSLTFTSKILLVGQNKPSMMDSHKRRARMLVVSLRAINYRFWSWDRKPFLAVKVSFTYACDA